MTKKFLVAEDRCHYVLLLGDLVLDKKSSVLLRAGMAIYLLE